MGWGFFFVFLNGRWESLADYHTVPVLLCCLGLRKRFRGGGGCCLGFRGFVRGLICVGFGEVDATSIGCKSYPEDGSA